MSTREQDFEQISLALSDDIRASAPGGILAEGDSLLLLRKIPDHSVSLILTDPPYHSTKKRNIYGDTQFEEDQHYLEWMESYAFEWKRVLRPNGSLFCFCDSSMSARLEVMFSKSFNILSHVVWTKPNGYLEKYRFFWEWQRDLKGSSLLKAAKWQLIEVP